MRATVNLTSRSYLLWNCRLVPATFLIGTGSEKEQHEDEDEDFHILVLSGGEFKDAVGGADVNCKTERRVPSEALRQGIAVVDVCDDDRPSRGVNDWLTLRRTVSADAFAKGGVASDDAANVAA